MVFNLGAAPPTYPLTVTGVPGATVSITNGKKNFTQTTDSAGNAVFQKLKKGMWSVIAKKGEEEASYQVSVGRDNSNDLNINAIPDFDYTGIYQIVDDNDNVISSSIKNWKVRFLTGGTLRLKNIKNADDGIDVFCVGGGGGGKVGSTYIDEMYYSRRSGHGGGGGYTTTHLGLSVATNTPYTITIGSGGQGGTKNNVDPGNGGETSAFNGAVKASGGMGGTSHGGNGGSGGGGGAYATDGTGGKGGAGGTNGNDGYQVTGGDIGGTGQHRNTREFGETSGKLYSSGGNAYGGAVGGNNTGNGGGGGSSPGGGTGYSNGGAGGSGIVVIRNKR